MGIKCGHAGGLCQGRALEKESYTGHVPGTDGKNRPLFPSRPLTHYPSWLDMWAENVKSLASVFSIKRIGYTTLQDEWGCSGRKEAPITVNTQPRHQMGLSDSDGISTSHKDNLIRPQYHQSTEGKNSVCSLLNKVITNKIYGYFFVVLTRAVALGFKMSFPNGERKKRSPIILPLSPTNS